MKLVKKTKTKKKNPLSLNVAPKKGPRIKKPTAHGEISDDGKR